MANFVIYHNPRCSKSRQTLALLEENGIQPTVVEYLKTPPTVEQLQSIVAALGVEPRNIIRNKEAEYKEAGLDDDSLTTTEILEKMVAWPKVIERPIVVKGKKAVVGRPPENVLKLIQS